MDQTVALIDLFDKKFVIPHYQRGYRWEAQEVTELLDDLWNFEKTSNKGEFYCLQPIVLQKKDNEKYDVLDGQQRLTTLYLILVFLEEMRLESGYNQQLFTLDYETRPDCQDFLINRRFINTQDDTNIDYHHITSAFATIKEWFADSKHAGAKMKLVPILMDKNDRGNRNVRFIWYEADNSVNPIEVFIRLNVGKIPLTDAELIKALLLQSDKYSATELSFVNTKLLEIATEWDNIECTMQEDEFWYFLNNQNNNRPTHIEFIFDLIADNIYKEKKYFKNKPSKHATFLILSEYLQDLLHDRNKDVSRIEAVETIWSQVTKYFGYFKDWFNNRALFHYIGFLIVVRNYNIIDTLIEKANNVTKTEFEKYLRIEIGRQIQVNKNRRSIDGTIYSVQLQDLSYEHEDQRSHDRAEIQKILLLHNVYSTLKSEKEKAKFPFNLYKSTKNNERWSLEHIHAQKSNNITNKDHQIQWLNDHITSLSNDKINDFSDVIKKMKKMLKGGDIDNDDFDELVDEVYEKIDTITQSDGKKTHLINNLCLIDAITNSKLNNSVFDVKREIIKKEEVNGRYIPLCTRNVFLKAYTQYPPNNAYWTNIDRESYYNSIKATYDFFINSINEK